MPLILRAVPEPVALARVGMAADGVVLIRQPHDEDDVERCSRVVEKLRHDGFHSCGCDGQRHVVLPTGF